MDDDDDDERRGGSLSLNLHGHAIYQFRSVEKPRPLLKDLRGARVVLEDPLLPLGPGAAHPVDDRVAHHPVLGPVALQRQAHLFQLFGGQASAI